MRKPVITLSQACDGMIRSKTAEGVSVHTVRNYRTAFKKFQTYIASHPERSAAESKDPPFASITRGQLVEFFAWLREEYVSEPDGAARQDQAVAQVRAQHPYRALRVMDLGRAGGVRQGEPPALHRSAGRAVAGRRAVHPTSSPLDPGPASFPAHQFIGVRRLEQSDPGLHAFLGDAVHAGRRLRIPHCHPP